MNSKKGEKKKKVVAKKHRHKWVYDYCDCPFCIAEHSTCECGEMKNESTGKINDF